MPELMTGNEAAARGAYEAGVKFAAAYPGTPSTEILENLAKYEHIYAQWSTNEKVSLEVAVGASIGGVRSVVSMKHVGMNVAADPLLTVSYMGVNGGLVIITADDPGMHSSQNEQDNRYYARFAKLPMFEPSDSQEAKDYVKYAFDISEKYNTPVLVRLTTRTSHARTRVVQGDRNEKGIKEYRKDIEKYISLPSHARKMRVLLEDRLKELNELTDIIEVNEIQWRSKDLGIITCGTAYQYVREACPEASVLKLGFTYPVPMRLVKEFSENVEDLIVVEELEPLLENDIKAEGVKARGKDLFPRFGELNTQIVSKGLGQNLKCSIEPTEDIPQRPPVLCPGCPHRGVFYNLRKFDPVITGDIGCYTLGALPPLSSMDTCLSMGASIGKALGLEKADGSRFSGKTVAVIGDSTFLHSGITGLLDVVYNKGTVTTIILDNEITAMTGHQHHPGTGFDAKGIPAPRADLEAIARAAGVRRVVVIDPYNFKEMQAVLNEELEAEEPSVVIARRPCILLKHAAKQTGLVVSDDCNGCRTCLSVGCPALSIVEEEQARIEPHLCVGCGMCAQLCPKGVIRKAEGNMNG